ncbi:3'-5' exonuclease, partial [Klebsiella pneumoniae]
HDKGWLLLAFASCHRFGGEFRLYPDGRLQILMNCEDRLLSAGQHWQSEALICLEGADREALLAELAERIAAELMGHKFMNRTRFKDYAILYRGNHQSRIFEKALMTNRIPYRI